MNSYYDQKDYAGRSVHYWRVVLPLLEKVRHKRSIPEPLQPMFMHFQSRDIQVSPLLQSVAAGMMCVTVSHLMVFRTLALSGASV